MKSTQINVIYNGHESRNYTDSKHKSIKSAKQELKFTLKSIKRNGGAIIKSNSTEFSFINNDSANTLITYQVKLS